ncbi:jg22422, partial [Pararge aegeria aegeria]
MQGTHPENCHPVFINLRPVLCLEGAIEIYIFIHHFLTKMQFNEHLSDCDACSDLPILNNLSILGVDFVENKKDDAK